MGLRHRAGLKLQASDVRLELKGVLDVHFNEGIDNKVADRLRQEPWVESLAAAWRAPLYGTFRIPLVKGRNFTAEESRLWPGQDALGQSLRVEPRVNAASWVKQPVYRAARVVGIARDVVSGFIWDGVDTTCIYFPTGPLGAKNGSLLVRVKGEPEAARRALDAAITGVSTELSFIVPMDETLAIQIYPFRASSWIAMALGGLALSLSLSGIYGVLSYLVSQRTKEIGIRIALGASTSAVVRIVLSQSMKLELFPK